MTLHWLCFVKPHHINQRLFMLSCTGAYTNGTCCDYCGTEDLLLYRWVGVPHNTWEAAVQEAFGSSSSHSSAAKQRPGGNADIRVVCMCITCYNLWIVHQRLKTPAELEALTIKRTIADRGGLSGPCSLCQETDTHFYSALTITGDDQIWCIACRGYYFYWSRPFEALPEQQAVRQRWGSGTSAQQPLVTAGEGAADHEVSRAAARLRQPTSKLPKAVVIRPIAGQAAKVARHINPATQRRALESFDATEALDGLVAETRRAAPSPVTMASVTRNHLSVRGLSVTDRRRKGQQRGQLGPVLPRRTAGSTMVVRRMTPSKQSRSSWRTLSQRSPMPWRR